MSAILLKDQTDNGKQVTLSLGQVLAIRLPENPTTGYGWAVDEPRSPDKHTNVVTLESTNFTMEPTAGVGGGGVRTFMFKVVQIGVMQLHLKLWHRWEQDIIDRFNLVVHVSE